MNARSHRMARAAAVLAAALAARAASGQDVGNFPFDRFSIAAGSFYQSTDANLRLDAGTVNAGTLISFEDDLGLDKSDQLLRIDVEWRPFNRSQFTAGYYELTREGSRSLGRDIVFGDTVFPVRASIETDFDFQYAELYYTFWAVKQERGGFGINFGASALSFDTSLTAQAELPGGGGTVRLEESASTDLPIPLIGVEGRYALTPRFLIAGNVRILPKVQIEDYEGEALTYGARLEYRLFRHFGLGASWSSFNIDAEVEKQRFLGALDFTIEGAQAFVRVGF